MSEANLVLSGLLGVGLAGSAIAWSIYSMRRAMKAPGAKFVAIVFRGMALRMISMLLSLIAVFLLLPVHAIAFAGAFLIVALVGLVIEVRVLMQIGKTAESGSTDKN